MPIKSCDSGRFKSAKHSKAKRNKSLRLGPATRGWNKLRASKNARNATNPLRMVTDSAKVTFNPDKVPIRLERASCILQSEAALNAVCEAVHSNAFNDYSPSVGLATARSAIAEHFSRSEAPFTADDVVLASGCSHALELAIAAVAEPGQNILVPGTGFPHYSTLCRANGIESRGYRLRVGLDWLVDTAHLEGCIDANTRAIVVNNPANPSGTVFPKAHLEHILRIADKHKVPIIADEIYAHVVHSSTVQFHPIATLRPKIPTIVCDGISKRYSVPGWRLGWLIVHDRGSGVFADIKQGIVALCQKTGGPCTLVQAALPRILRHTPDRYFDLCNRLLARNAESACALLGAAPGVQPLRPQAGIHMLVRVDAALHGDGDTFVRNMIAEESVFCMPGSAFNLPGWIRLSLALSDCVLFTEACQRIANFCRRQLNKEDGIEGEET